MSSEPYQPVSSPEPQESARPAAASTGSETTSTSPSSEAVRTLDDEMAGELLDRVSDTDEESLESIVETMKRDRA
jgi:anti-sigma28 factor (negative regulator of flagellin synthesis)